MTTYPLQSQALYNRVCWLACLNIEAHRRGYFDTLLCETADTDIETWLRFIDAIPQLKLWLEIDQEIGNV
jgi:hypothetical protein